MANGVVLGVNVKTTARVRDVKEKTNNDFACKTLTRGLKQKQNSGVC